MEKDTVLISTLHNGSGSFTLHCKDDGTGLLDIFDKQLAVSLETTKIHSIVGNVREHGLMTQRPFRSPHHTISDVIIYNVNIN